METTDDEAYKSLVCRAESGGNDYKSLEKRISAHSGPRGRWFNRVGKANSVTPTIEGSQSDPSLVEMLINHEYFGFFLLILGVRFR